MVPFCSWVQRSILSPNEAMGCPGGTHRWIPKSRKEGGSGLNTPPGPHRAYLGVLRPTQQPRNPHTRWGEAPGVGPKPPGVGSARGGPVPRWGAPQWLQDSTKGRYPGHGSRQGFTKGRGQNGTVAQRVRTLPPRSGGTLPRVCRTAPRSWSARFTRANPKSGSGKIGPRWPAPL